MNNFNARLSEFLKTNNITQSELAKQIEMSQSVVNNYCSGKREPSFAVLCKICTALNVSSDYLLGLVDYE